MIRLYTFSRDKDKLRELNIDNVTVSIISVRQSRPFFKFVEIKVASDLHSCELRVSVIEDYLFT
jgi:hypothetical protein